MSHITDEMEEQIIEKLEGAGWIVSDDIYAIKNYLENKCILCFEDDDALTHLSECNFFDDMSALDLEELTGKLVFDNVDQVLKWISEYCTTEEVANQGLSLGEIESGIRL